MWRMGTVGLFDKWEEMGAVRLTELDETELAIRCKVDVDHRRT